MKSSIKTILALALALAPCFAQAVDKCNPPGKDVVCFDARTTGSLGQMHVRKSKTLVIRHLNRIKNDYTLQRGITVLGSQSDLLSGLSFIPTAPGNPPATTPQGGTHNPAPPTPEEVKAAATPNVPQIKLSLRAPAAAEIQRVTQPPKYTSADAQRFLNQVATEASNNILLTLVSRGFSAAELQSIKAAMKDAATAVITNLDLAQVANALQTDTQQSYVDQVKAAEAAAYQISAAYIQHVQFANLAQGLDGLSVPLTQLQQDLFVLKDAVAAVDRDLAGALASAQSFAVDSDALDPTAEAVMGQVNGQITHLATVTNSATNWPFDVRKKCNDEMLRLKQDFAALASLPGYNDWKGTDGVKDRLSAFSSALDADATYINGLNPDNSDRVTALGKARKVLAHFQLVYSLKGQTALTEIEEVFACRDDTQKGDYTLVVSDMPDSKTASVPVVTFTCYAPLSLSGGIGFNSLAERTFQLVTPPGTSTTTTGTTTPASTIQYDKNSSFQVAPLLLLHVRICNLQDWGALHASFGAGVSIPASGSGTTSGTGAQPAYLGGLSVSLRDRVYFTAGPFFGRTNTLAHGYSIGSSLPSGVTTIPLQTKFSAGFGVAVTFKLK